MGILYPESLRRALQLRFPLFQVHHNSFQLWNFIFIVFDFFSLILKHFTQKTFADQHQILYTLEDFSNFWKAVPPIPEHLIVIIHYLFQLLKNQRTEDRFYQVINLKNNTFVCCCRNLYEEIYFVCLTHGSPQCFPFQQLNIHFHLSLEIQSEYCGFTMKKNR